MPSRRLVSYDLPHPGLLTVHIQASLSPRHPLAISLVRLLLRLVFSQRTGKKFLALHFFLVDTLTTRSLYLDIWRPANATSDSNLPVKVWLYGGGNAAGGISDLMYNGCELAATDAVVVSVNYRLGPFGWLSLLSANLTGNFGLQDQLLALQWVQDNIADFGGDPVSFRVLVLSSIFS